VCGHCGWALQRYLAGHTENQPHAQVIQRYEIDSVDVGEWRFPEYIAISCMGAGQQCAKQRQSSDGGAG